MRPTDLDLPERFADWRPGQADTVLDLAADDTRFSLLSAPTGSGKSLIAMALSRVLDTRTLILTSTKRLQDQYRDEFGESGLVDVRGQTNYRCPEFPPVTVADAPCHDNPPDFCQLHIRSTDSLPGCPYYDQIRKARAARVVVTNYAKWLTVNRWEGGDTLGEFGLVVCDEGHGAADQVTGFVGAAINERELAQHRMWVPIQEDRRELPEAWADWADYMLSGVWEAGKHAIDDPKRRRSIEQALKTIRAIPRSTDPWVVEPTRTGVRLVPIWPRHYAKRYLFPGDARAVLMSATLTRDHAKYLGIGESEFTYHEAASTFPPTRRPFIFVDATPRVRVDHRMIQADRRIWARRIDQIIEPRIDLGWRGLIHTRSYKRAAELQALSRFGSNMFVPESGRRFADALRAWQHYDGPGILVTAAAEEGIDLPHDACRYQIIAKVPFVDGRAPLAAARRKDDADHALMETGQTIIQCAGRAMRAESDWCETFLIDDHFRWFQSRVAWPAWFKTAWRWVEEIPEPMEVE